MLLHTVFNNQMNPETYLFPGCRPDARLGRCYAPEYQRREAGLRQGPITIHSFGPMQTKAEGTLQWSGHITGLGEIYSRCVIAKGDTLESIAWVDELGQHISIALHGRALDPAA